MNTETPDLGGKLLAETLRSMADRIEADPETICTWRLYDGATQPIAFPHVLEVDGVLTPGALIQMSERHFIWAPHDIALRLSLSLAWAATACSIRLAEEEAPK